MGAREKSSGFFFAIPGQFSATASYGLIEVTRASETLSPSAVVRTLTIQNSAVMAGTFLATRTRTGTQARGVPFRPQAEARLLVFHGMPS